MASDPADSAWHRLHPTTLVFRLAAHAKALLLPGVLVVYFSKGEGWEMWIMLIFVPSTVYEVIRYVTLKYRFQEDELVVRQGLIFRSERHIPFERIQNIDLVQNVVQRALKVANVRLETASGQEAEATLNVLSLGAVEVMRSRVFSGRRVAERETGASGREDQSAYETTEDQAASMPQSESPELLLHLCTNELLKLSVISWRGLVLIAAAFGLAWQFDLFDKLDWFQEYWETNMVSAGGLVWALLAAVGIEVALLLSMIWTIQRSHGYRLERVGDDLRISCGLLTRRSATVPRHRIQFLSIHETILHRLFGRVSIRIETAAGGSEWQKDEDKSISQKWFVPLIPKADVSRILQEVQPGLDLHDVQWRPLAPRARKRMFFKRLLVALLLTVLLALIFRPWGALALFLLVPGAWWHAVKSASYTRYARSTRAVFFRSGVFTRKVSAALQEKIQAVAVWESPFDRRYGMAGLWVDTAGAGPADHRIFIPYLPRSVATETAAALFDRVEGTLLRW